MENIHIVIGLGYGDEGKGTVTAKIALEYGNNAVVVRFSGTSQASHHVVFGDKEHRFSHVGAGAFSNAKTYWAKTAYTDPPSLINELVELKTKGLNPVVLLSDESPLILPYDVLNTQIRDKIVGHGTTGGGLYSAFKREEAGIHLPTSLINYPNILKAKLYELRGYYDQQLRNLGVRDSVLYEYHYNLDPSIELFMDSIKSTDINIIEKTDPILFTEVNSWIFEGSQGIMLDKDFGLFPHVTPSKTTAENALKFISEARKFEPKVSNTVNIHYVTRTFATKHGNGPLLGEYLKFHFVDEVNKVNEFQGNIRYAELDLESLQYALTSARKCYSNYPELNIVEDITMTCYDAYEPQKNIIEELRRFSNTQNLLPITFQTSNNILK